MSDDFVTLYDSTLRDGAQTPGVDLSLQDKHAIAAALDDFGIDYIEGGFAGSNPLDGEFFASPPSLKRSRLTCFGMTRRANVSAAQDKGLRQLDESRVTTLCLVGKASLFQVTHALGVKPDENLAMIADSFAFLHKKNPKRELFFDAEHFFDGAKDNEQYAMQCLQAAVDGGASVLVLCDTNGGTMSDEVERITQQVVVQYPTCVVGIHTHDDTGQAVANSLAAVRAGARHVQGTLNGLGERCGNANLITIIPNLMIKMGMKTRITEKGLRRLTTLSHTIDDILNRAPYPRAPYVGQQSFAHKGGLHGSAIAKKTSTYEHIDPSDVGNERQLIVSQQAGRSIMKGRLKQLGIADINPARLDEFIDLVKAKEHEGYAYDGALASFDLLAHKHFGRFASFYDILDYRVVDDYGKPSHARLRLSCKGETKEVEGDGNGPVHALDLCLRRALEAFYPCLATMSLEDYKVRILNSDAHTQARILVRIGCHDTAGRHWETVGVSTNVIEASFEALTDGIDWKLTKENASPSDIKDIPEDFDLEKHFQDPTTIP